MSALKFPCTVRQFCEATGRSQTSVRKYIKLGFLITDPDAKVTRIIGGVMASGRCQNTPDMFPETLVSP